MPPAKEFKQEEIAIKEFLVERVKHYEAIWNTGHPDHKKSALRINCWLHILKELQEAFTAESLKRQSVDDVNRIKDIWLQMRGTYRKIKGKTVGKSGAAAADVTNPQEVKWPFYSQMTFLEPREPVTQPVNSLMLSRIEENDDQEHDKGETTEAATALSTQELFVEVVEDGFIPPTATIVGSTPLPQPRDQDMDGVDPVPSTSSAPTGSGPATSSTLFPPRTTVTPPSLGPTTAASRKRRAGDRGLEVERAKIQHQEGLLQAMNKLSEKKPADENVVFCEYLATQLQHLKPTEQVAARKELFDVVHVFRNRTNLE